MALTAEDVMHHLECIEACQQLIDVLESKAKQYPLLADDIGDAVIAEKQTITYHRKKLEP